MPLKLVSHVSGSFFADYLRRSQDVADYVQSKRELKNNDERYGYLLGVVAEMLKTGSVESFRSEVQSFKEGRS